MRIPSGHLPQLLPQPALPEVPVAGRWLATREQDLLGTDYFHVVFTVPQELNVLALDNQRLFNDLLFNARAQTMLEVAADPEHVADEIGLVSILHTWGHNLLLHPHIHCVIPSGATRVTGAADAP